MGSNDLSNTATVNLPSLRTLIRSQTELSLLDSLKQHGERIDEAVEEILSGWEQRTKFHRANEFDRKAREAGWKGTSTDAMEPKSLEPAFTSLSTALAALASESLPALEQSVKFNRMLVRELIAEDCTPLARSKQRVAEAESILASRLKALLNAEVELDEDMVKEEFANERARNQQQQQQQQDQQTESKDDQAQDALMTGVNAHEQANGNNDTLPTSAGAASSSIPPLGASLPLVTTPVGTPVKLAATSQPSSHTSPATCTSFPSSATSSGPASGISSSTPSQLAMVTTMLPNQGSFSLQRRLQTQANTAPGSSAAAIPPVPGEQSLTHDSTSDSSMSTGNSIPLAQPDRPNSPTFSAHSISQHLMDAVSPGKPTATTGPTQHTPDCTPSSALPVATAHTPGLVTLLETPQPIRAPAVASTPCGIAHELSSAQCTCTPHVQDLDSDHQCRFRSPPFRSASAAVSGEQSQIVAASATVHGSSSSGSQSALSQLYLSQYAIGALPPTIPGVPGQTGESQHSLSLALSPSHAPAPTAGAELDAQMQPMDISSAHLPAPSLRAPPPLTAQEDDSLDSPVYDGRCSDEEGDDAAAAKRDSEESHVGTTGPSQLHLSAPAEAENDVDDASPAANDRDDVIMKDVASTHAPSPIMPSMIPVGSAAAFNGRRCYSPLPFPLSAPTHVTEAVSARQRTPARSTAPSRSASHPEGDTPGSGSVSGWKRKRKLDEKTAEMSVAQSQRLE